MIQFGQPTIPAENCSIAMRGRIRRRIGPAQRLPDDIAAEHVADGAQDHGLIQREIALSRMLNLALPDKDSAQAGR
jgi:hypothetical protein